MNNDGITALTIGLQKYFGNVQKEKKNVKPPFQRLPIPVIRVILGEYHIVSIRMSYFSEKYYKKNVRLFNQFYGKFKVDRLKHVQLIFRSVEFKSNAAIIGTNINMILKGILKTIPLKKLFFLHLDSLQKGNLALKHIECVERLSGLIVNNKFDRKYWNERLFDNLEFLNFHIKVLTPETFEFLNTFKKLKFVNIKFNTVKKEKNKKETKNIICKNIESMAYYPYLGKKTHNYCSEGIDFVNYPNLKWIRMIKVILWNGLFRWINEHKKLTTVEISCCDITNESRVNIVLRNVKKLVLNNQFGEKHMKIPIKFIYLKNVRYLTLFRFKFNDKNIGIVFNEENEFKKINLSHCIIKTKNDSFLANTIKNTIIENIKITYLYKVERSFIRGVFRNKNIQNIYLEIYYDELKEMKIIMKKEKVNTKKVHFKEMLPFSPPF